MSELPFTVHLRVPVDAQRVRERARRLHDEEPGRPAFDNWILAEMDLMAEEFARLWQLRPLTCEMDAAFRKLHHDAFKAHLDWFDFGEATSAFLDAWAADASKVSDYFHNFTGLAETLRLMDRLATANGLWERAVECVTTWERRTGSAAKKATGLYFWGVNCILAGDLLRGFTLVHESLREDARVHGVVVPDTLAAAIATLNYEKPDQPLPVRLWLKTLATIFLADRIRRTQSALTLADFRTRFLATPSDWSRTFSFVYTLAALRHLHEHPALYRTSDFAGQVALDLFFNIAVVVEGAIREKNGPGTFITQAAFLLASAGSPVGQNKLGAANAQFNADFDATIRALLDGSFSFADGSSPGARERAVLIAYGIRNRGGHDTNAAPVIWERFDEVLDALVGALVLSVETLY